MVRVRVVSEADLPAVLAAFPEAGAAPANRHVQRFVWQRNGDVTCLVAWDDDTPVGHVFLRWPGGQGGLTEQARALGCVELGDLAVVERARGQGIGRKLMEAAEALAAGRGHAL